MTTTSTTTTTPTKKNDATTAMKAIQVHDFIDDFDAIDNSKMTMDDNVAKPTTLKKDQILVKVLSCSISPGDVIMVRGNLIFLHEAFPFIPGMDICGVVEDTNNNNDNGFQKGDIVVASNGISPVGGMAEYVAVAVSEAVKKPDNVAIHNASASSSAITARNAVMDHVKKGDRVLILGGSGGVGSAAIQIAKQHAGASFVATTSSQERFCKDVLGADQVINYNKENWWEMKEFTGEQQKFDKIIDTVGGGNFYGRAEKVLKTSKQGGEFIAVTGDDPKPDCRTVWKAVKFFANLPMRPLYTWMRGRRYPKYVLLMPYDVPEGRKQVLDWMEKGTLKIPLDDSSPLPFTVEGVQKAFQIVASGHAHGKVVVSMEKTE